ncbi:MAG: COP23 domain-containing protein [Hormoscilla sp.]
MKQMTLTKVLAALMCVLGATVALDRPSAAESAQRDETLFFCRKRNGIQTTMYKASRGPIPLIRWRSEAFALSGWTPEKRCKEVSKRFQRLHESEELKYFNIGKVGNYYVVCGTQEVGVPCNRINMLFTILPDESEDPNAVLEKLLDARDRSSSFNQSQHIKIYDWEGNLYIDVEELLYDNQAE